MPDESENQNPSGEPEQPLSDEEQVAMLEQTPAEELAVDPDIEQPSQVPTDVVESDPGAEDTE